MFSFDLLADAIVFGLLLGCFYTAVSIGLSVAFGLLDVPHIAHPAFVVLGSYGTWLLGRYGWDPIVAGVAQAIINGATTSPARALGTHHSKTPGNKPDHATFPA